MASDIQKRSSGDAWPFPAFGRFFDDWAGQWPGMNARTLRPAMDVEEDGDQITVRTELPGIAKEDVNITLEDGVLTITGEKKSDRETKNKNYHVVERTFGTFQRSLSLPSGVDAGKADASFDNGILTITVPKTEHAKPRQLQIK